MQLRSLPAKSLLWLIPLLPLFLFLFISPAVRGADSYNYMRLLSSLFLDQDLFLGNEIARSDRPVFMTATSYPLDIHNFGVTLFWLPFYAVAHLLKGVLGSWAAAALEPEVELERFFSVPWLRFADWLYGMVALYLTASAIEQRLPRRAALLGTLLVAAGSPALYYMGLLSPSVHAVSIFLAALFLYGFLRFDLAAQRTWLGLGIVGGLALCVANTNVALLGLPLAHFALTPPSRRWLARGATFSLFYTLSYLPQLLLWWLFTGEPLKSPYHLQLLWGEPHLGETLFSSYHGLYFYAPLLLLATLGMGVVWRLDRKLALGSLLVFAITLYLSSINLAWWAGGAFGARYLLGVTPFFALGLACLFARASRAWQQGVLLLLSLIGVLWTALLYPPYALGLAPLENYYPPSEQVEKLLAALERLPEWGERLFVAPTPPFLLFLLLFTLLATLVVYFLPAVRQGLSIVFRRREAALLPVLLLLVMGVVMVRSSRARDVCLAEGCHATWIRSDVDQVDLAYTYVERARYHAQRDEWARARADMEQALAIYPTDPHLQHLVDKLETSCAEARCQAWLE